MKRENLLSMKFFFGQTKTTTLATIYEALADLKPGVTRYQEPSRNGFAVVNFYEVAGRQGELVNILRLGFINTFNGVQLVFDQLVMIDRNVTTVVASPADSTTPNFVLFDDVKLNALAWRLITIGRQNLHNPVRVDLDQIVNDWSGGR